MELLLSTVYSFLVYPIYFTSVSIIYNHTYMWGFTLFVVRWIICVQLEQSYLSFWLALRRAEVPASHDIGVTHNTSQWS